jgi:hypothetical protein
MVFSPGKPTLTGLVQAGAEFHLNNAPGARVPAGRIRKNSVVAKLARVKGESW